MSHLKKIFLQVFLKNWHSFLNVRSTCITCNRVGVYLIIGMNFREANMIFLNGGILEQTEYHNVHIPKTKAEVVNVYPVSHCKPIPVLFMS